MSAKFITTWFYAGHEKNQKVVSRGFLGMRKELEEEAAARVVNLDEVRRYAHKGIHRLRYARL